MAKSMLTKVTADKPIVHLNEPEAWGESADGFLERLIEQVEKGEICEGCFMPVGECRTYCPENDLREEEER